MGQPHPLVIFVIVLGYVCVGGLLFAGFLWVAVRIETRARAALGASGPETAVAQERRAAVDLGYGRADA